MPGVYRPYPQPQQGPKIAPLIQVSGQVTLEALATGRAAIGASINIAVSVASRIVGSSRTLAASSVARPLTANVSGNTKTRAAVNAARLLTANAAGSVRTLANSIVARSLAVRSVGRTGVINFFEGAGAITGRIGAGARVVGSLIAARALDARTVGRTATRAGQRVAYALSSTVQGRTSAGPNMRAAFALISTIRTGARTLATTGIARAIAARVATGARVVNSLPPAFVEVVGIIRIFLRASMELIGIKASMRRDAIVAPAETETLITAQYRQPIEASVKKRAPIVVSAINMIAKNVSLKGYVIGDDTEIAFQLTDWPAGVLLSKAYFTMKKSLKDLDAAAIIQRDITGSLTAEGQITANGSLGTAEGYFLIRHQDAEWANVKPNIFYEFDIQSITDQSTLQTPIVGTISFVKGRTDATS